MDFEIVTESVMCMKIFYCCLEIFDESTACVRVSGVLS